MSGDHARIEIRVDCAAKLVVLTQASTKIFRHRPPLNSSPSMESVESCSCRLSVSLDPSIAVQQATVHIGLQSLLCWLPQPVTPFQRSSYRQEQDFFIQTRKEASSEPFEQWGSLLLLDWFSSGRKSRGAFT